ncbi:MAG: MBOAT family protein [Clostridia bacterium]|nr:MBOAT family protein [Clostridia bacterium]
MVFSSLFFVFVFFILNYAAQAMCSSIKGKNIVMLLFSLVFYAWGGPKYLLLLCGMTAICWFFAVLIDYIEDAHAKKILLIITCAATLSLLGYFKYATFLLENIQGLTGFPAMIPEIVLPIGISFYTFQLLSYVADVYRGEVRAQKRYWVLLFYASLFHQCIAGPIVRYQDVEYDILHRRISLYDTSRGITRFSIGLAKKALLANSCAVLADSLLPLDADKLATASGFAVFLGGLCYMLQIYLDFSAYSDMAIGMGLMEGFHYLENFNYPYTSDSITDFWRRWHISLGSFFRDYVYIPLGGNRCSKGRQVFNLCAVWFLTGLWHGASWNYVLWGLYFLVFLLLEKFVWKFSKESTGIFSLLRRGYAMIVVYFGWFLFRFEDLGMLGTAMKNLFGGSPAGFFDTASAMSLKNNCFFLILAILACFPLAPALGRGLTALGRNIAGVAKVNGVLSVLIPPMLVLVSLLALVGNSYNPFLYFQF